MRRYTYALMVVALVAILAAHDEVVRINAIVFFMGLSLGDWLAFNCKESS